MIGAEGLVFCKTLMGDFLATPALDFPGFSGHKVKPTLKEGGPVKRRACDR